MTQTRWTPGPWSAVFDESKPKSAFVLSLPNHDARKPAVICRMRNEVRDAALSEEDLANLHILAAAPLMYSELESAPRPSDLDFTNPEAFKREYKEWWERRNAALRTARGETQEQQS